MYYVSKNGTGFYVDDESQLEIYNKAGYEVYELKTKPMNTLAKARSDDMNPMVVTTSFLAPEPTVED